MELHLRMHSACSKWTEVAVPPPFVVLVSSNPRNFVAELCLELSGIYLGKLSAVIPCSKGASATSAGKAHLDDWFEFCWNSFCADVGEVNCRKPFALFDVFHAIF